MSSIVGPPFHTQIEEIVFFNKILFLKSLQLELRSDFETSMAKSNSHTTNPIQQIILRDKFLINGKVFHKIKLLNNNVRFQNNYEFHLNLHDTMKWKQNLKTTPSVP